MSVKFKPIHYVTLVVLYLTIGKTFAGVCDTLGNSTYDTGTGTCQCSPGYYLSGSACTGCAVNSYKSTIGNSSSLCQTCTFGTWTDYLTAAQNCTVKAGFIDMGNGVYACPATTGYNSVSGFCEKCPVDTYSPVPVTTPCYSCAENTTTFVYTGLNFCWSSISYIYTTEGIICASGSGYSEGRCTLCSADYYKDSTGNSSCQACVAGTTTNGIVGSKVSENCVASTSTNTAATSSSPVGAIVGGVAAAIIVIVGGTSAAIVFLHRQKRLKKEKQYLEDSLKSSSFNPNSNSLQYNNMSGLAGGFQSSQGVDTGGVAGNGGGSLSNSNNIAHLGGGGLPAIPSPYQHVPGSLGQTYLQSPNSSVHVQHSGVSPNSNGLNAIAASTHNSNGHLDHSGKVTSPVSTGTGQKSWSSSRNASSKLPMLGILNPNAGKQIVNAFGINGQETLSMVRAMLSHPRFMNNPTYMAAAAALANASAPNSAFTPDGSQSSGSEVNQSQHSPRVEFRPLSATLGASLSNDGDENFGVDLAANSSLAKSYEQESTSILNMYQTAKLHGNTTIVGEKMMPRMFGNVASASGMATALAASSNMHTVKVSTTVNFQNVPEEIAGSAHNFAAAQKNVYANTRNLARTSPLSATKTTFVPHQMVLAFPAFLQINSDTGMRTIEKFAEGGFAILYKGELLDKSVIPAQYASLAKNVAIKVFKNKEKRNLGARHLLSQNNDENSAGSSQKDLLADLENEASIMYALNFSPNIARLVAVSKKPQLALVMQMYDESLASLLHHTNSPNRDLALAAAANSPIRLISFFSHDICAALQSIHSLGVAHLDIKPSNMLIERLYNPNENRTKFAFRIVLCDFGLARILNKDSSLKAPHKKLSNGISIHYAAPESFNIIRMMEAGLTISPTAYFAMDLFSIANTINEMLTREIPFRDTPLTEIEGKLLRGERPSTLAIPQPDNDQETLRLLYLLEIIRLGWSANPEDRTDANFIFELANEMMNIYTA